MGFQQKLKSSEMNAPSSRVSAFYENRIADNDHQFIYSSCWLLEETACRESTPCPRPIGPEDFKIDEAENIIRDLCPSYQKNHKIKIGETL